MTKIHQTSTAAASKRSERRRLAAPSVGQHDHRTGPPPLEQLGGALAFSDVAGRAIDETAFRGHWTLLFFGYSRCRASCPIAIPKIVQTAERLRKVGIEARAVFVDIDVPPLGVMRFRRPGAAMAMAMSGRPGSPHDHGQLDRVAAMRALANGFGGRLVVATGTRAQLSAASRAFNVAREHIPPRPGELGHSINHSSLIYFLAPDARVAGYAMHDQTAPAMEKIVRSLARRYA